MLHTQKSLCLASPQSAITRVGVAMLGVLGHFATRANWYSDREAID